MWSINVYRSFYVFVHCAFTIFEVVLSAIEYVNNKIVDFCHEVLLITETNKYLSKQVKKIGKTPVHLTVILGPDQPSYKDLANLVFWSLATRITFISFYDHKGTLKKNEHELMHEVHKRKLKEDHIIWHTDTEFTRKNGFIGRTIHVKVLTEEDGRRSVANLTKNYSSKDKDITIDNISQDLREQFEFPDPDLGLVCGKMFCMYNYPPWQIRVTEFLQIKSHHNIRLSFFIKQLHRYSKCEQRLGK